MFDEYRFSGSLPENASTYVTREADKELYESLKADKELYESLTAGKFCYVLNSRQSGKSSIRVRTMRRLRDAGVECAAIDLSAGGVQNVTPEQWYVDLIDNLIESFDLDVDLAEWWVKNQLHSEVTRFRKFIEEVLLVEVQENIVIFIDEIDSVLSLKFPTDDFFALIRACHNQRVDNLDYNRLTFCLLGVASPSNLIQDKQRTPFNIGRAINLKGFQLHEVEPLRKGLEGKFPDSQEVMQEILNWTGGQPFLTQKLCQLMVEESEKDNPRSVEQVARARIIENWELQDEPEHLRTIRSRILRDEERAGFLLDLYQQIHSSGDVVNNDSAEQSELLLSGLVGKHQNKLRVYNRIYQEVFNQSWVEAELNKLRPYSEAFRGWVASGCVDESRLLRGNALKDAEEWGKDKNLSYQDKQFLAASREQEIAVRNKEAELERERKDREAAEQRNQVLSEANKKAKQRIRIGSFVLIFTFSIAAISTFVAAKKAEEVKYSNEYLGTVENLAQRAGELEAEGSDSEAKELFSQAGQSVNIKDHKLRQAILYAGISYAYQKLKSKDLKKAQDYLNKSKKEWEYLQKDRSNEASQIRVLTFKTEANLLKEQGNTQQAISAYKNAYKILDTLKEKGKRGNKIANISPVFNPNIQIKFLSKQNVERLYRELIGLLSKAGDKNLKSQVEESLKEHYLDELNYLLANKKWQEADSRTAQLMLYVAKREEQGYFDENSLKNFSCKNLQDIDSLWVQNSDGRFGFSVQKRILVEEGNRLDITDFTTHNLEAYERFASRIGWYDGKDFYSYSQVISKVEKEGLRSSIGVLPFSKTTFSYERASFHTYNRVYNTNYDLEGKILLFSRCDL
ncbi:hypothetical protein PI95_025670 [Hassallia byssoidea VB512170]|uniref:GUN4-like domain-containing protein n=1 Tax=Hassallia byssoidea VB512170 TaxID=1304833 RepID=A0A846HFF6_9CYAN|nr:AAA-like domain-containing protein [Hassalia byssoidea]NEU75853.1 hypothetical protein [Hassalia byssoidea VB512170]